MCNYYITQNHCQPTWVYMVDNTGLNGGCHVVVYMVDNTGLNGGCHVVVSMVDNTGLNGGCHVVVSMVDNTGLNGGCHVVVMEGLKQNVVGKSARCSFGVLGLIPEGRDKVWHRGNPQEIYRTQYTSVI